MHRYDGTRSYCIRCIPPLSSQRPEYQKYKSTDTDTVVGLVSEKMTERVTEDDIDEDEREIWDVTHVSEEELETTEGDRDPC